MNIQGWSSEVQIILISCAAVAAASLLIFGIHCRRMRRFKEIVRENSIRLQSLIGLNKEYLFYNLDESYRLSREANSKQQYDRTRPYDVLLMYVREDEKKWETILRKAEYNRDRFQEYMQELDSLPDYVESAEELVDCKVPLKHYRAFEKELCKENELCPIRNVRFVGEVCYTSPQGRNSYHHERLFSEEEMQMAIDQVRRQERAKQTAQYQRQMMTPKMRYAILKRDQFRCVICGRSAEDGVKLHVDHILPVSRGGKSVPSNLRTLCEDCNLGKSDAYDANGLN